jgi:hypothetical protein
MNFATAPRGELIRYIYKLEERVEILEIELARLTSQGKGEQKSGQNEEDDKPEWVKANVKQGRRKKRKARDQGYGRERETPDETIFHSAEKCFKCKSSWLGKPVVNYTKQIIDIPFLKYLVTEHVVFKRWCYKCKQHVMPEVEWQKLAVSKRRMGVNLMSLVGVLNDRLRLPVGMIQTYLKLIYELTISQGQIVELLHAIADKGKPRYVKPPFY